MRPYRSTDRTDDAAGVDPSSRVEGLVAIALVLVAGAVCVLSGLFDGDPFPAGLGAALVLLVVILLRDELSGVNGAHEHDDRRHSRSLRAD